jgi:threonine/homoserine/homoserine lactone efflux protein
VLSDLLPGMAELAAFAVAVFVLNATPGVDFLLTVSRSLQGGARAGTAAVLGINAGCVVHALAAAFGLAALLAVHAEAFRVIQWAGAAYLVWLGLGMLKAALQDRSAQGVADAGKVSRTWWADFRVGLLTNVLNPKVALFFLAFLPQFVLATSPNKTASFLLLGAWFVAQGLLFSLGLVFVVTRLGRMQASATVRRALNALGGVLFIGLALRLLRERPALA